MLNWTTNLPTKSGWYWNRMEKNNHTWICEVFSVKDGEFLIANDLYSQTVKEIGGEWAGPLTPPKNRNKNMKYLFSMGWRRRPSADGYRIFDTEEELLKFISDNKNLECFDQPNWYTYSIFLVDSMSSQSVTRKMQSKIKKALE